MPPKMISNQNSPVATATRRQTSTVGLVAIAAVTLLALALTLMAISSLFGRLFTLVMTEVAVTTEKALKLASAHPDGISSIDVTGLVLVLFPALAAVLLFILAVALITYVISRQYALVRSLIISAIATNSQDQDTGN